jgi:membrane protease YdiL (CAAX protease family)
MEGAALAAALLLAELFGFDFFPLTENVLRDILISIPGAFFPLCVFICSLSGRAENIPFIRSLRKTMITEVRVIFLSLRFIDIFIISLAAGFAEEMLFRGIFQVKFGIVMASILGIVMASILFGLVHFITPAYVVVTVLMGFYIGFFYLLFGSLLIPILLHFVYDLGALTYLRYYVKGEE